MTHNNLIVEVLKAFKVLTQIVTEILEIAELNIEKYSSGSLLHQCFQQDQICRRDLSNSVLPNWTGM